MQNMMMQYLNSLEGDRETTGSHRHHFLECRNHGVSDPETLPALNPRLAYRAVIHATNSRKIWFALVPGETILTNSAPYLLVLRGTLQSQAYLLGIMSSTVVDWIGHLKINLNLNYFILNAIPVPVFDPEDPKCCRIAELATGLALKPGDKYGEWALLNDPITVEQEREEAKAEIDALASIVFGVKENQMPYIFGNVASTYATKVRHLRHIWL